MFLRLFLYDQQQEKYNSCPIFEVKDDSIGNFDDLIKLNKSRLEGANVKLTGAKHKHIVQLLKTIFYENIKIKVLNLNDNIGTDEEFVFGSESVAEAFKFYLLPNQYLESLLYSNNNIYNSSLDFLGESLEHNTTIKTLDLSNNGIKTDFLKSRFRPNYFSSFLKSLESNNSLLELNLSNNKITGVTQLIASLSFNRITSLDLSDNNINNDGAYELLASITNHENYLQKLNLTGNNINEELLLQIQTAIENNARVIYKKFNLTKSSNTSI